MSPRDEQNDQPRGNFRFDEQFVELIRTQAEQKVLIGNLAEKVKDIKDLNAKEFENLNKTLTTLTTGIEGIRGNCIAHKVLEETKPKEVAASLFLGMKPDMLKAVVIIVVMAIGYFLGIPLPKQ